MKMRVKSIITRATSLIVIILFLNGLIITTVSARGKESVTEMLVYDLIQPSGDTTGVTDWTNIDNALQEAGPGDTVQLAAGTFYLDRSIIVYNFDGILKGAGKGVTVLKTVATDWYNRFLNFLNPVSVTVEDLTIDFDHTSWKAGLRTVGNWTGAKIRYINLEIKCAPGEYNVRYPCFAKKVKEVTIQGCTISGASGWALAVYYLETEAQVNIHDNTVKDCLAGVLLCEGNKKGVEFHIADNNLHGIPSSSSNEMVVRDYLSSEGYSIAQLTVVDNKFTDLYCLYRGLNVGLIADNEHRTTQGNEEDFGIKLIECSNMNIIDNNFQGFSAVTGLYLLEMSSKNMFEDNNIEGSGDYGIRLDDDSNNNVFDDNDLEDFEAAVADIYLGPNTYDNSFLDLDEYLVIIDLGTGNTFEASGPIIINGELVNMK